MVDNKGNPLTLSIAGSKPTFSEIVRRFCGDVSVHTILGELMRVGAVKQLENGRLSLLKNAYIPEGNIADKLYIMGTDVKYLLSTIDHNLIVEPGEGHFQRKVLYDNLPDETLPEFRNLSTKRAQKLLEYLDGWMAQNDRDVNPSTKGTGRNLAGLGIYYFEQSYHRQEE